MTKIDKSEIAFRLRSFISKRFKSVAEAARNLSIAEGTLRYAYLKGKSLPGFEALYSLSKAGLNIEWLFTEEGKMLKGDSDIRPEQRKLRGQAGG